MLLPVQNTGVEFTAASHKSTGAFSYTISGNVSTAERTKCWNWGGSNNPIYGVGSKTEIGQPVGQLFGFRTQGLFQSNADVASHALQTGAAPGDVKFLDVTKDGTITDSDCVYLGNAHSQFILRGLILKPRTKASIFRSSSREAQATRYSMACMPN